MTSKWVRNTMRASSSLAALSLCTSIAQAQISIEEGAIEEGAAEDDSNVIIVTARKRNESIQDVPLAISALGGEQLAEQGITSFDQVLSVIPNASQSSGIAGTIQGLVSIRGISTLVRFVGLETGVGFYVDGVYTGRPENFNQDLIDIERVEVLRGPQGALFGKNTIAGAINIITKQPSEEFSGTFEAGYGNYNAYRVRGYVSGPLVEDKLSASFSAGYTKSDGYTRNISGIQPDLDAADLATFRGKLRATPSDGVEFILSADALIDRGRPSFFEVSDVAFVNDPSEATPFTVNNDQPNFLRRDIWGASLTSNIDIGPGTWTTIAAYRDTSFDAALDDDKVPVRFFVDAFGSDTKFWSVESRYAGEIVDGINLVAGVYYLDQQSDNQSNFALGDFLTGVPGVEPTIDLTSSVDTTSIAVFFDIDAEITDRLSLELGGRFVSERKIASHVQVDMTGIFGNTNFNRRRRDNDFAPTVSLSYKIAPNVNGYLRYAEGFKSAGFNTDFVTAGSNLEVNPEKATSYEAGLKTNFLNNRIRFNLAGFYTDYENLQVSQITGAGVTLTNAAQAEIYGIEADFTAGVSSQVDLNGSVGYLNATYKSFPGCPRPGATPVALTVPNCAGNFLNLAPELSVALGAQFTQPVSDTMDFFARTDWNFRSKVFFEPQNTRRLSGRGRHLVNLRAGVKTDRWELTGWVNNLFEAVYVNFADDRSAIAINTTQGFGPPRTYGVTGKFTF